MSEDCVRIERLANGYEVEIYDPKIAEMNRKRDNSKPGMPYKPWVDPKKSYAFPNVKAVLTFLEKNLETAIPMKDEYGTAFDTAVAEEGDD